MQLTGCTTTDGASDPAMASFAPMPDLAMTPVPAAKPDTPEGHASLAAQVENDTEALMQAAGSVPAPQTKPVVVAMAAPAAVASATDAAVTPVSYAPTEASPAVVAVAVPKPTIPDEAVDVANAAPVQEAAVGGGKGARECLMRAMYFESNRSSHDGQLAVGTVVMHRVAHGAWGKSVCSVVGAHRQFAPGVMSRKMQGNTSDLAALADAILKGKRHPKLPKNVMFFHVAGMKFPYKNMRYVLVAGGNTFYYKSGRKRRG
jgi:hypothetical protein